MAPPHPLRNVKSMLNPCPSLDSYLRSWLNFVVEFKSLSYDDKKEQIND